MSMRHSLVIILTVTVLPAWGQAEVLPDPTRPAGFENTLAVQQLPAELVDWNLSAIRMSGSDRTAIVNGRIVREGDTLGPARIIEIRAEGVLLDYNNRQVIVRLFSETQIKKPVNNESQNQVK